MRFKNSDPAFWILAEDLEQSAQYLTNKFLLKSIAGCAQCLLSAFFQKNMIRNKRTYDYWFSKDRKQDSLDKFFPDWPFRRLPVMTRFTSRQAKWTRKCAEHFDYVKSYFANLLDEYYFRFGKTHGLLDLLGWVQVNEDSLKLPSLHSEKIVLEYRCLPAKYRKKNLIDGYRSFYATKIDDPVIDYVGTKRNTPFFLINKGLSQAGGIV